MKINLFDSWHTKINQISLHEKMINLVFVLFFWVSYQINLFLCEIRINLFGILLFPKVADKATKADNAKVEKFKLFDGILL